MRDENVVVGILYCTLVGYVDDLILIHAIQLQPFLMKYLLIMVFVSPYQKHMFLEDEYPDTSIIFCHAPNFTKFKYLGSYISQNKPNMGDIEIKHCKQMSYAKFVSMTNLLQNSSFWTVLSTTDLHTHARIGV